MSVQNDPDVGFGMMLKMIWFFRSRRGSGGLLLVLAGLVTNGAIGPTSPAPAAASRIENVLLITVDTLRWDAVGFNGAGEGVTPTVDRLAASGVAFLDAHAHNVVTLPSHANILTGLYPYQHGVRDNQGFVLPQDVPTAASVLQKAGFATGAVIGAFPLDARFGLDRGFDLYDDDLPEGSRPTEIVPAERRGDEVVKRALTWWRSHDNNRRFLWVHLFDPHAPYLPPEPYASKFTDPYRGEVAATDAFLRPLLEPFLTGDEDPTLIVFTADHGESLGDHGELTHGTFAYESTLKVPLIIWHPGIRPENSSQPVRHVDLLPTILEAVDVSVPDGLPGHSLLSPVGEAEAPSKYFEALTPALDRSWAPLRGTIHRGHKLIDLPVGELYDLTADPTERRNLYKQQGKTADRLVAELPTESQWPAARGEVDSETEAELRALGYLGGSSKAKREYTEADDPKNLIHLDNKMHQVVELYSLGRLEQAESKVREVLKERPDMSIAYYYLAQVLLQQGRLPQAIETMVLAQQKGMATPALTRQLGMSLAEIGRAREAVELLEPLAQGGGPDDLNALGLVLSEAGDQRQAQRILERVFESDPRNAITRQHLALVALRRQDWMEAQKQARQALDINDGLVLAWNYLGTAQFNLRQPEEALRSWDRALAVEPDNFDVLYNVAIVAMEIGDREQARRALERFVATAPPEQYGPDIARAKQLLQQLSE